MAVRNASKINHIRQRDDGHSITVYNRGRQTVHLQVKPPGGDFFLHEQVIYLKPGKSVQIPKNCANSSQIRNLQAKRQIQITHDTEAQPRIQTQQEQEQEQSISMQLDQDQSQASQPSQQNQPIDSVVVTHVSREQEPAPLLNPKKKRK